ncbi:ABC transporter substrate-binding protein [Vibrio kyushuensis]|uniref:ABC transporter substrate-binding protein n=1 Tax=Vibrio kyushuensis TaxID=2910249 RepID=UPI003D0A6779
MKSITKRRYLRSVAFLLLSAFSVSALAQDILTSTPVTYAIASELTKDTSITTQYLPPKRYGIERLPNWFATKGTEAATQAGEKATVAITMSSVWQSDPTYVFARQGNIGLIEIDAAQAITPRAQGVAALTLDNGSLSKYVWLNPSNLIRMSVIVADDLKRIWPQYHSLIDTNLQAMMLNVRTLINTQQDTIFDNDIDSIVLLSEALEDFASGNQLFVVDRVFQAELEWSDAQKQNLKTQFNDDETLWLVTARQPSKSLLALVPKSRILVVDSVDRWGSKGIQADKTLERWELRLQ